MNGAEVQAMDPSGTPGSHLFVACHLPNFVHYECKGSMHSNTYLELSWRRFMRHRLRSMVWCALLVTSSPSSLSTEHSHILKVFSSRIAACLSSICARARVYFYLCAIVEIVSSFESSHFRISIDLIAHFYIYIPMSANYMQLNRLANTKYFRCLLLKNTEEHFLLCAGRLKLNWPTTGRKIPMIIIINFFLLVWMCAYLAVAGFWL